MYCTRGFSMKTLNGEHLLGRACLIYVAHGLLNWRSITCYPKRIAKKKDNVKVPNFRRQFSFTNNQAIV